MKKRVVCFRIDEDILFQLWSILSSNFPGRSKQNFVQSILEDYIRRVTARQIGGISFYMLEETPAFKQFHKVVDRLYPDMTYDNVLECLIFDFLEFTKLNNDTRIYWRVDNEDL